MTGSIASADNINYFSPNYFLLNYFSPKLFLAILTQLFLTAYFSSHHKTQLKQVIFMSWQARVCVNVNTASSPTSATSSTETGAEPSSSSPSMDPGLT
ncbi:MAG TPA: hypothetical protein V6C65_30680, partial [Allocoleopsis sp.]